MAGIQRNGYCLITPCRNESEFAKRAIESVLKQSFLPKLWIVVDDGSTDATAAILKEYSKSAPFMKIIHRPDRGFRKLGGGVIDAFYAGYDSINPDDYEFVCKHDLDLDLPANYFELVAKKMSENTRLGTFSGKPYMLLNEKLVSEKIADDNSAGMVKFYRTACFRDIGGFVREVMWDGIDGHLCRMKGWIALSLDEPELRFIHLRPMGTSDRGWWTGRVRHGKGQYFMGTTPLYLFASAISRMFHPPVLVGTIAILYGYIVGWLTQQRRYGNAEFRRFLRRYQWNCLFFGRTKALRKLNQAEQSACGKRSSAA